MTNDIGGSDDKNEQVRVKSDMMSDRERRDPTPSGPRHHDDRGPRRSSPYSSSRHEVSSAPRPRSRSATRSRGKDRPRDRDRDRRPSPDRARRGHDQDDLIPRYRDKQRHRPDSDDMSRRRSRSRGHRERDRERDPASPSSSKRHRSPSPSMDTAHRKKSRKRRSRSRHRRNPDFPPESKDRRRRLSHGRRKPSPRAQRSPPRADDVLSRESRSGTPATVDSENRRARDARRHNSREESLGRDSRHSSTRRSPSSRPRPPLSGSRDLSPQDMDRASRHSKSNRSRSPSRERKPLDSAREQNPARQDDEDMPYRTSYRGGHSAPYPHRDSYSGESRGYAQSPHHRSGYGSGRDGWADQYSSQSAQQYPSGPRGAPTGPASHHQGHPPTSPSHPPSGPRNSQRGGFRGAPFQGRGGRSGPGFKSGPWGQGNYDVPERSGDGAGDDGNRSTWDRPTDDSVKAQDNDRIPKGPSGAAPPTGPSSQNSSSKFSFAFKPSSKPAPATPKPEISQKFNAAPKKASTDTPSQQPPQQPPQQPSRDPPPTAPREPASARPRLDTHRPPPEGPRITPRTRKVKKLVRRPKPRPTLPPDLAASESVFFRKPGNESVVGSGTYGKVFKGLNVYTKGLVALKKIRMEGERDGFPVTAVREIKLLQSLRHTNIVNLQEVMVEKNDCYMVFEYLSHDLTGLLNHPTFKLEPAQKKHLAKQLFDGLDYLHNRGVLHRDLKAANILVSNQGILKLADFGLARFYAKRHQLDYTNRVITIWYRSPELLLGETQYTAAVDIWSAACVMVEIFTKHAIFPGDGSELNQLDKIYSVLGTPSRQAWPGVVNMPWFELLRPEYKRKSVFKSKYEDRVTPAAFELLESMFLFDPAMRPTAAEVLAHPYFATEEPQPRQAVELEAVDGEWHEFESKALRKENERKEREARKAREAKERDNDKKRGPETQDAASRDAKRVHVKA